MEDNNKKLNGFFMCPFCGEITIQHCDQHTNFCESNPNRKKRKKPIYRVDEKLYTYTKEYLKTNKNLNTRNLAKDYYNTNNTQGLTYGFTRVLKLLETKGIIKKNSKTTYIRKESDK